MATDPAGSLMRRVPSALRDAWDGLRNLTTTSPARFAVLVFVSLILLFTALL